MPEATEYATMKSLVCVFFQIELLLCAVRDQPLSPFSGGCSALCISLAPSYSLRQAFPIGNCPQAASVAFSLIPLLSAQSK